MDKMEKLKSWYLYATVFITGAAVLIIEILGTRILSPFYGSTIFVWSSLIAVTLGFLALGYWIGGWVADRKPQPALFYAIVFLSGVILALVIKINQLVLIFSDMFGIQFGPLVASTLLFFMPFFLLGAVTPFAIRLRTHAVENVGFRSGSINAFATVGSLIGALLAGFALIPLFAVSHIFYFLSVILAVLALVGVFVSAPTKWGVRAVTLGSLIIVGVLFLPAIKDTSRATTEILYHTNSFYGDIKITGSFDKPCLYVDGSNQSCVVRNGNMESQSLFAKQALALAENLPEGANVLLLGLGGGSITSALPDNISLDIVEIDPHVVELARQYFGLSLSESQHLFLDDARRFIRKAPDNHYDLIIEDIALGASLPPYLFTKESFAEMQRVLKPDGLVAAHIGTGSNTQRDSFAEALVATADSVFSSVDVYSSHPSDFSNSVLYFYEKASPLSRESHFYHSYNGLTYQNTRIATDNYNRLHALYIPHAVAALQNSRLRGNALLFTN